MSGETIETKELDRRLKAQYDMGFADGVEQAERELEEERLKLKEDRTRLNASRLRLTAEYRKLHGYDKLPKSALSIE